MNLQPILASTLRPCTVNQGNRTVNGFLNAHWPVAITPLITGLIGMITQCFLTQRAGQLFIRPVYRWA